MLADPDQAVAKGAAIYASNRKAYHDFYEEEAAKSGKTVEELKAENLVTGEMDRKFAVSKTATGGLNMKLNITDVLSRTYGISTYIDEDYSELKIQNMLMINDKLPAKKTGSFYTIKDNQSVLDITIYESRSTEEVMEIEGTYHIALLPE